MTKVKHEKGTILIATLLLLAVVTVIAVGLAERSYIDIKRTSQLLSAQQAYLYVESAEIWAVQRLKALPITITQTTPLTTWPQVMPILEIPGGSVNASLSDAQGEYYNLNNLIEAKHQSGFFSLFNAFVTEGDVNRENQKFLMAAIVSWISPAGQKSDVLSDQYYLNLQPPYRAAHQLFVSPSELRLVKDVTPSIYTSLFPTMIALPESTPTPININTATYQVLTSVGEGISVNEAQEIVQIRQEKGRFQSLGDFFALPVIQKHNLSAQNYSLDSNYFLLKTMVNLNNQQLSVYTLFKRTKNEALKTNDITRLWQLRGTL